MENKTEAPFLPSNRCLSLGPSPPSLRPRPFPLPPKSCVLCGLVPGLPGAGPEDPDVTCQGGRAAREGGVTGPGSAPRRAPSPALFCSGIAAGGGSQGARPEAQRLEDGPGGVEGPRRAEGPAVIRRGGRGCGRVAGAARGGSSGYTSGWKRALSRPPWLWGCPPRKRLPATCLWSVGT